jgi:hypothetical protein
MTQRRVAVHEEAVVEDLLSDLSGSVHRSQPVR